MMENSGKGLDARKILTLAADVDFAIGAGIGAAIGNIAIGVGVGVALGVAIGVGLSRKRGHGSDEGK